MDQELSQGLKVGLIVGSIFIPLLGIILGIIWMTGKENSEEKRKFGKTILIIGIVVTVLSCVCSFLYMGAGLAMIGSGY